MSRKRGASRSTRAGSSRAPVVASAASTAGRVPGVDALRGGALCLMFVYHFSFDLRHYHLIAADFEHDPFWLALRALIVTSFMVLVGISLVLADRAGTTPSHFWKRVGIIIACAALASAGSGLLFPRTFIYFGMLHCIAAASMLGWPFVRRPLLALTIGLAVIVLGLAISLPAFDERALSWIGFTTHKPDTEDYVPLAPWSGVVLVGIALGSLLTPTSLRLLRPLAAAPRWLCWLGRHSLAVYMVHQPILLGLLWVVAGR